MNIAEFLGRLRPWLVVVVPLVFVVAVVGCDSIEHRRLLDQGSIGGEVDAVIPMEIERGLLVVRPSIKGEVLEMILETGAFENKLTRSRARQFEFESVLTHENDDTFGQTQTVGISVWPEMVFSHALF
ncbi:MAG: hypothetical protein ACJA0W_003558 [Candidatus Azotimanducaceae bacterium]|jgi:hypothetical protein